MLYASHASRAKINIQKYAQNGKTKHDISMNCGSVYIVAIMWLSLNIICPYYPGCIAGLEDNTAQQSNGWPCINFFFQQNYYELFKKWTATDNTVVSWLK